jgi:hypothetical protein
MPRDGSGNFTLASNTQAVSGDPISSTKFNTLVQDLEADANTDRPIVAGGTGASTALAARANLGLEIGVNVQAYDAGLASIAGLTTLADRSIYTTASDTYAVYTLTAAGRAILDDADAAAQRTTLGLGTAAVVNTGTSGATIPLLDGANTWSAAQTFSANANLDNGNVNQGIFFRHSGVDRWFLYKGSSGDEFVLNRYNSSGTYASSPINITAAGVLQTDFQTIWHAGNDGAGSGLDADTLDGVQGSAYAALAGAQTFTGAKTFSPGDTETIFNRSTDTPFTIRLNSAGTTRGYIGMDSTNFQVWNAALSQALTFNLSTGALTSTGTARVRQAASAETTGTLTAVSANATIQATGDITVPNAVFAAGDIILIYAGASSRTITEGASVTMRLGGTATTGSRTLAARGVAVLFFVSSSEVVVSGGAVT